MYTAVDRTWHRMADWVPSFHMHGPYQLLGDTERVQLFSEENDTLIDCLE